MKAKKLLQILLDSGTPAQHRINLSEMQISYLQQNFDATEREKDKIYTTFRVLTLILQIIDEQFD